MGHVRSAPGDPVPGLFPLKTMARFQLGRRRHVAWEEGATALRVVLMGERRSPRRHNLGLPDGQITANAAASMVVFSAKVGHGGPGRKSGPWRGVNWEDQIPFLSLGCTRPGQDLEESSFHWIRLGKPGGGQHGV